MNIHPISNSSKGKSEKKAYQSPELKVFGDIGAITKAVDMSGAMDGGTGLNNKT